MSVVAKSAVNDNPTGKINGIAFRNISLYFLFLFRNTSIFVQNSAGKTPVSILPVRIEDGSRNTIGILTGKIESVLFTTIS